MPKRALNLDELLYPIASINVPGMANISSEEAQAADECRQKAIEQGAINNINVLTRLAFSQAVGRRDFATAQQLVQKYYSEGNLDDTMVGALDTYLNGLQ